MLKEVGPIERAIGTIQRLERELALVKAELAAYLPEAEPVKTKGYLVDPVTGRKHYIKRKQSERRGRNGSKAAN
jgi:hypothetical protein